MAIKLVPSDLKNITIAHSLRGFGGGLVELFIPLILIKNGLSVRDICWFYLIYAVAKLVVNYPTTKAINKYGAKFGLTGARVTDIIYLLIIFLVAQTGTLWLVWAAPLFLALTNSFQWNSEHLYLGRAIKPHRIGKDLARLESIGVVTSILAPFLAGGLTLWLGAAWPLGVAIVAILLSAFWVRRIDSEAGGHQVSPDLKYSLKAAPLRDLIGNFSFNFHTAVGGIAWPIYLAVVLANAESIGVAMTVGGLISILFIEAIGRRNDRKGNHKVLFEGSIATAAVHSVRFLATSVWSVTAINLFWLLALRYQQNPWTSIYYSRVKDKGISYILSMEIAGDIAYICLMGILLALTYIFTDMITVFNLIFWLAAGFAMLCVVIKPIEKR